MNCKEYQTLNQARVDGQTLSPTHAAELDGHLAHCSECAEATGQLGLLTGLLRGMPSAQPDPRLRASLQARLAKAQPVPQLTCEQCEAAQAAGALAEAVTVHLANCTQCSEAQEVQGKTATLPGMPMVRPPAQLRADIAKRLAAVDCQPVAQLSCEEAEPLLAARLDGELTLDESTQVEVHLANCVACTRSASVLESQRDLLRSMPPLPGPEAVKQQIHERVAAHRQSMLLLIFEAIRRSRRAALVSGTVFLGAVCATLGVMNSRTEEGTGATAVATSHETSEPRELVAEQPVADEPVSVATVASDAIDVDSVHTVHPATTPRRTRVRLATYTPAPRATTESPAPPAPPVNDATATLPSETTPDATPAETASTEEPVVSATTDDGDETAEVVTDVLRARPADEAPAPVMTVVAVEPERAAPTTTPVAPRVYVNDSPANAPRPERLSPPRTVRATTDDAPQAFEAPPVDPEGSRPRATPTQGDILVKVRERLKQRQKQPTTQVALEDDTSKTAELNLVRVEF